MSEMATGTDAGELLSFLATPCDDPACPRPAEWILWARSPRPCGCIPARGRERVCVCCDPCLTRWNEKRYRCPSCGERVGRLPNLIGRMERI